MGLSSPYVFLSGTSLFRSMENGRDSFPFPYKPYDIQEKFMKALYSALDQGKVGIFESPTGTVCMCEGVLLEERLS